MEMQMAHDVSLVDPGNDTATDRFRTHSVLCFGFFPGHFALLSTYKAYSRSEITTFGQYHEKITRPGREED
jgi:hypothetical protein